MGLIVVGVDGSPSAERALEWAAEEARLRGDRLRLVQAWTPSIAEYAALDYVSASPAENEARERAALALLRTTAADVLGPEPDLELELRVAKGPAATVLLEHAAEADLLVVGSRGLGGFKELLLGSVSHDVVHEAPCPVVVVRHALVAAPS